MRRIRRSIDRRAVWEAVFGLAFFAFFISHLAMGASAGLSITGTQGLGNPYFPSPHSLRLSHLPRINVLEVDAWRHSLDNGSLCPVAEVPVARHELIRPDDFSPDFYSGEVQRLDGTYARQRDVLMYFGGVPNVPHRHGLNFNGWSVTELARLRAAGSRPFIGLETTDPKAVEWMVRRLHDAGYGHLSRVYVRICSEPSGESYGSEDGTAKGKRHTRKAYAAYQRRFAAVSGQLHRLNLRYGLDLHTVFAGTEDDDFKSYMPPEYLFDNLGYDLYVTPENKQAVLRELQRLRRRLPWKPIVIPEFGIATDGPGASPRWAQDTLGDILMTLGQHPAGVECVTVFSVNVAARVPHRRWNWAWTPVMFEMLKEWQREPRRWHKDGFHRYDPLSYPVGRNVLYLDRPDLRIMYRKLSESKRPGVPYFYEVRLRLENDRWIPKTRTFAWNQY